MSRGNHSKINNSLFKVDRRRYLYIIIIMYVYTRTRANGYGKHSTTDGLNKAGGERKRRRRSSSGSGGDGGQARTRTVRPPDAYLDYRTRNTNGNGVGLVAASIMNSTGCRRTTEQRIAGRGGL